MSSALLYLAIVAVWAVVLVPMWLRRDAAAQRERFGRVRMLTRRRPPAVGRDAAGGDAVDDDAYVEDAEAYLDEDVAGVEDDPAEDPEPGLAETGRPRVRPPVSRRRMRARVIARRRRRTTGLVALLLVSVCVAATGAVPWWTVLPPVCFLLFHLALLRAAAQIDAERARARAARRARLQARQAHQARQARLQARPAAEHTADVIDITARAREEIYDQYADAELRAVGD